MLSEEEHFLGFFGAIDICSHLLNLEEEEKSFFLRCQLTDFFGTNIFYSGFVLIILSPWRGRLDSHCRGRRHPRWAAMQIRVWKVGTCRCDRFKWPFRCRNYSIRCTNILDLHSSHNFFSRSYHIWLNTKISWETLMINVLNLSRSSQTRPYWLVTLDRKYKMLTSYLKGSPTSYCNKYPLISLPQS